MPANRKPASDDFDPFEDFDDVLARNAAISERAGRERAERDAWASACAKTKGDLLDQLQRLGFRDARVTVHPHGTIFFPGRRATGPEIDVRPAVGELRYWDGFKPAAGTLRAAVSAISQDFGSMSAALGLCASETRSRWRSCAIRVAEAETPEEAAQWRALLLRGVTAIRSEANYRRGLATRP